MIARQAKLAYQIPGGWHTSGSHPDDYIIGIDTCVHRHGKASGSIRSKPTQHDGYVTLMQNIRAGRYREQRMRLSGYARASNITSWAGLWMRIDSAQADVLEFDNMENRPIIGTTDWQPVAVVLDVPANSVLIAFGLLLTGQGQVWIDGLQFEAVGAEVASTNMPFETPAPGSAEEIAENRRRQEHLELLPKKLKRSPWEPVNLDFGMR
ncbi:MAG: hypothetical protein R3A44_28345 [Caldilineaceae bacterium]